MKKSILFILAYLIWQSVFPQLSLSKKWDKRFGGTSDDFPSWIQQTFDGGYIIGGISNSNSSGDKSQNSRGGNDYWAVKIDSLGNRQWDKRYGGTFDDELAVVLQTSDSGYILGGWSSSGIGGDKTQFCWGEYDYWIVKIDKQGNKEWDSDYGGALDDIFISLQQTTDGGYILGGFSNSWISGDKTQDNWDNTYISSDYWIIKIDGFGIKKWDKRFGGTSDDVLHSVLQTNDGGYLMGGHSSSDTGGDVSQPPYGGGDYWVVKTDSLGNKQWDKQYGGLDGSELWAMLKTNDGGYIIAGVSSGDAGGNKSVTSCGYEYDYWIVKIDSAGNKLWDKDYGGYQAEKLNTISPTSDGGFLIAGWSFSNQSCDKTEDNLGSYQTWVVKVDSLGNKQWDKTIFTTGTSDEGYAIQASDGCYVIAVLTNGGIGGYKTQPNWDTTNQTDDYWIVKFCDTLITGLELVPTKTGEEIFISPNPFGTDVAIAIKQDGLKEAAFTIYNMLGQSVYTKQETNLSSGYTKMLDLSYLPNGVYFVEVVIDGERVVKKVVKE